MEFQWLARSEQESNPRTCARRSDNSPRTRLQPRLRLGCSLDPRTVVRLPRTRSRTWFFRLHTWCKKSGVGTSEAVGACYTTHLSLELFTHCVCHLANNRAVEMIPALPSVVGYAVKLCQFHVTFAVGRSWIPCLLLQQTPLKPEG